MQKAIFHDSTDAAWLNLEGPNAFDAKTSIAIYADASWQVFSENPDPWLNQHASFYVAETIEANSPEEDIEDASILKETIESIIEKITDDKGELMGAN